MWNPLAYLDYNNLWRTMDEMGKEVWHEALQLTVSAQLGFMRGRGKGLGCRQVKLLWLEQAHCWQEQPHILVHTDGQSTSESGILASSSESRAAEAVCTHPFIFLFMGMSRFMPVIDF